MVDGIRPGTGRLDLNAIGAKVGQAAEQVAGEVAEKAKKAAEIVGDHVASSLGFDDDTSQWETPEEPVQASGRQRQNGGGGSGTV